jgi:hypothetical protein
LSVDRNFERKKMLVKKWRGCLKALRQKSTKNLLVKWANSCDKTLYVTHDVDERYASLLKVIAEIFREQNGLKNKAFKIPKMVDPRMYVLSILTYELGSMIQKPNDPNEYLPTPEPNISNGPRCEVVLALGNTSIRLILGLDLFAIRMDNEWPYIEHSGQKEEFRKSRNELGLDILNRLIEAGLKLTDFTFHCDNY